MSLLATMISDMLTQAVYLGMDRYIDSFKGQVFLSAAYPRPIRIAAVGVTILCLAVAGAMLWGPDGDMFGMQISAMVVIAIGSTAVLDACLYNLDMDDEFLYAHSPWRAKRRIPLSSITFIDYQEYVRGHVLYTRHHGRVYVSDWLLGGDQILDNIEAHRQERDLH